MHFFGAFGPILKNPPEQNPPPMLTDHFVWGVLLWVGFILEEGALSFLNFLLIVNQTLQESLEATVAW